MDNRCTSCNNSHKMVKEFCYNDKLCIDPCKPSIKNILDVCVKLSNVTKEIICTCTGFKLAIKGLKVIKVKYESCGCGGEIITSTFTVPFFELIPLNPCMDVYNLCSKVCYCNSSIYKNRCIYVSSVIAFGVHFLMKSKCPSMSSNIHEASKCADSYNDHCDSNAEYECHYSYNPCYEPCNFAKQSSCNSDCWKIKNDCW